MSHRINSLVLHVTDMSWYFAIPEALLLLSPLGLWVRRSKTTPTRYMELRMSDGIDDVYNNHGSVNQRRVVGNTIFTCVWRWTHRWAFTYWEWFYCSLQLHREIWFILEAVEFFIYPGMTNFGGPRKERTKTWSCERYIKWIFVILLRMKLIFKT